MTIGDNRDYIRVLLYSYYTTITGWGVLLRDNGKQNGSYNSILGLHIGIVENKKDIPEFAVSLKGDIGVV